MMVKDFRIQSTGLPDRYHNYMQFSDGAIWKCFGDWPISVGYCKLYKMLATVFLWYANMFLMKIFYIPVQECEYILICQAVSTNTSVVGHIVCL